MIEKPKKERRFLKALGRVGEILIQEVLLKVGSNLVKRIGGKKTLPSILFLFLSISLFAQYPATGNKQRLGYQTTGDGLVYRGRALDTVGIKSSGLNNAYFILDTVNNILYNYIKTKGGWKFTNTDSVVINNTVDTTSLSNRINLKVNISDTASMLLPYLRKADTASMLTPYFRDADTTSLNLVSRFAAKLNISDTSSMLINYLRTGVAAGTYLPLTGGTMTGALNGTTGKFTTNLGVGNTIAGSPILFTSGDGNQEVHFAHSQNIAGATVTLRLTNNNAGFFDQGSYFQSIVNRGINEMSGALGTNGSEYIRLRGVDDGGVVGVGIFNTNPSYNLDVTGTFRATGNSLIGGTLGVTGATTLTGALTVNNATVLNEGSGDFDTRIESDGNANMVFVDASTDRVGIGTNTPSKTLEVNGEVKIATVTATPTALLGKDGSNVVGEVSLGTGMSVSGGILSVQAAGASATGLVTSFGSQIFGGNKTFNGTVTLNDELNLSSGYLKRGYLSSTSTSITVGDNDTWLNIHQDAQVTITLPLASSYTGRELIIKQTGSGVVTSASQNIIGFTTAFNGSTQTAIINPANRRYVTLVSDGTNWVIMQTDN
jgi:hypothetical protein